MLAKRAMCLSPSPTLAVSAQAKALKEKGIDVVEFGAGEPDFDTPNHIKQAAIDALNAGFTKYPLPVSGIQELRQAIANKLKRENGLDYALDEISVGIGGKGALFTLFQVMINPGDEVIIPAPYWVSYPEMAKLCDGVPVFIDAPESADFKLTPAMLDKAITPKTKLFVLNSPSNPTGAVYTPGELAALAEVLVRRNVHVVSDEIYERLTYDGVEQKSIASLGPEIKRLTIVCNGLAKAYSMTGWRIGYLAGPREIISAANNHASHSTSGPTSFVQKGAAAALNGPSVEIEKMREEFDRRRKFIVERLNALPGISCRTPKGAFYAFANIEKWIGRELNGRKINGSVDFCAACLADAHVAIVPGIAFGPDKYVRFSYATSMQRISEGLDRMEQLLRG